MDDLDKYLHVLFEGQQGLAYSPVKTEHSWEQNWFDLPTEIGQLKQHILSAVGDVYVSPAIYSERRATKDNVKKVQTAWIEFDGTRYVDFRSLPKPSLIVQSSLDTHSHCYWRIDPTNSTSIEELNRRLTYYLSADTSGWDATQLLRPPGTTNHKRGLPVLLNHYSSNRFSLATFDLVPKVQFAEIATVTAESLLDYKDVLRAHQLPSVITKLVLKEKPVEPYRSSFLTRLANELAEESLEHIEIVSLLYHADLRIEKYSGRSDQLLRLSQIADHALHKSLAENTAVTYTPRQILDHTEKLSWLYPGWLHSTGFMLISSAPGVGKTQMTLQMAYALTEQNRFLGYKSPYEHRVGYLSLEMDIRSLQYIFEHQQKEWVNPDPKFLILDEATTLIAYENWIAENEINVLFVDSLSELFDDTADNPNAEAKRIMKWVRKIKRRYGCAVIIIHHNRKATEGNKKPKGLSDLVGSFMFGKEADTVLQLWEDHKGIELSVVKARFGMKSAFMIQRNSNLWFTRAEGKEDVSNEPKSGPIDPTNPGQSNPSPGHRNQLHGESLKPISLGPSS